MQMRPALLFTLAATLLAQETIRIDVTRAQVDAIVTDKAGKPVKDLTVDDFEIFADSIRRPLQSATYFESTQRSKSTATAIPTGQRVDRSQITRSVAFLIDDIKMSPASVYRTRLALHQFIDKQLAPGDLIAILSTSRGFTAIQQFTTDPRILHKAVDRTSYQLNSATVNTDVGGNPDIAMLTQRQFALSALSGIKFIAAGMRGLPGRKSIVLFSDGLAISKSQSLKDPNVTISEVRDVSDSANRSSVVIYAVDTRGIEAPPMRAEEDLTTLEVEQVVELLNKKRATFTDNQQGLSFLALETGGTTRFNSNDILDSVSSILEEQSGYYLLTFSPNEANPQYSRLLIRLKRPGLKIRYRKQALPPPFNDTRTNLLQALASPFATTDIPLRLLPISAPSPKSESQLGALLHIDCSKLDFRQDGQNGGSSATIQIVSVTEGESPIKDATTQLAYTIRATASELEKLKTDGLIYALQAVVVKPGPYQIRAAVLDVNSKQIGAASTFIEIPAFNKSTPVLSNLSMTNGEPTSEILRTFTPGKPIAYSLTFHNHNPAKSPYDFEPRILQNDKMVWQGKRIPLTTEKSGGTFTFGPNSTPGEYILQVLLIPRSPKSPSYSNWVDFELLKP